MDNLKKYLLENRDALDTDLPGEAVWQRIRQSSQPVAKQPAKLFTMTWRLAAAACAAGAIAAITYWLAGPHTASTTTPGIVKGSGLPDTARPHEIAVLPSAAVDKEILLSDSGMQQPVAASPSKKGKKIYGKAADSRPVSQNDPPSLTDELTHRYAQLVGMQLNRLRTTPLYAEDANYFNDFKMQLRQMDEDEAAIRQDIKSHGLNDVLLNQLINIYQQKLAVLKNLQTEINKMNNQVKQKQLPTVSIKNHFINI